MSTFFFLLFVAAILFLFGAAGIHALKRRREFKRGMAEIERMLSEDAL